MKFLALSLLYCFSVASAQEMNLYTCRDIQANKPVVIYAFEGFGEVFVHTDETYEPINEYLNLKVNTTYIENCGTQIDYISGEDHLVLSIKPDCKGGVVATKVNSNTRDYSLTCRKN